MGVKWGVKMGVKMEVKEGVKGTNALVFSHLSPLKITKV